MTPDQWAAVEAVFGAALIVAGVALLSVPWAFIVAGLLVLASQYLPKG